MAHYIGIIDIYLSFDGGEHQFGISNRIFPYMMYREYSAIFRTDFAEI